MALFSRKKAESSRIIDLRDPAPSNAKWGSPVPCPECSGRGYLDHIDPYREIMFIHCTQCNAKYEVARADMAADTTTRAFTI